ncbi:hypothetical protein Bpfe_024184, partial [Biomphalaria pfeifferi]
KKYKLRINVKDFNLFCRIPSFYRKFRLSLRHLTEHLNAIMLRLLQALIIAHVGLYV